MMTTTKWATEFTTPRPLSQQDAAELWLDASHFRRVPNEPVPTYRLDLTLTGNTRPELDVFRDYICEATGYLPHDVAVRWVQRKAHST